MKIINLKARGNELEEKLSPYLKGQLFHITTSENWIKIKKSGHITGKDVNDSLCQQRSSYGPKRNYVCMFDWKNNPEEIIEQQLTKLYVFDPYDEKNDPIFVIFKESIETNIIPNEVAVKETGYRERFVPKVECWHPDDIPLGKIKTVLITKYVRDQ
jgi:hypothetical protein